MPKRLTPSLAMLAAAALAGCASVSNFYGDPWVQPGKFQFLRCQDLTQRIAAAEDKQRQLRVLMDRANNSVAGTPVSALVYGPDMQGVEAELRLLHKTSGEKRCADEPVKKPPNTGEVAPLR